MEPLQKGGVLESGQAALGGTWIITIIMVIVAAYYALSRKEEKVMIERFGDEYGAYVKKVPIFFPNWEEARKALFEKDEKEDAI